MDASLESRFVHLLKEHQNILHKICRLYTADESSHQDLFQEMVIQLWKAYPSFREDAKFTTWAYRVSLNTAISLFRVKSRKIQTVPWDQSLQQIYDEDHNAEEEEKLQYLYAAVRELSDVEKALVYMYLEDKDYVEIAETLGISEGNARVRMNRVKGKLKTILSKKGVL